MKEKHQRLLKVCTEQEKTLEEVGVRLRDTKLEADNLKLVAYPIFINYCPYTKIQFNSIRRTVYISKRVIFQVELLDIFK